MNLSIPASQIRQEVAKSDLEKLTQRLTSEMEKMNEHSVRAMIQEKRPNQPFYRHRILSPDITNRFLGPLGLPPSSVKVLFFSLLSNTCHTFYVTNSSHAIIRVLGARQHLEEPTGACINRRNEIPRLHTGEAIYLASKGKHDFATGAEAILHLLIAIGQAPIEDLDDH